MAMWEVSPAGTSQGLGPPIKAHFPIVNTFSCRRTSQEYFGNEAKREDTASPSSVVLNQRIILPPVDMWHCLETLLIVVARWSSGMPWLETRGATKHPPRYKGPPRTRVTGPQMSTCPGCGALHRGFEQESRLAVGWSPPLAWLPVMQSGAQGMGSHPDESPGSRSTASVLRDLCVWPGHCWGDDPASCPQVPGEA